MPISFIFWPILLLWIGSSMFKLRGVSGPYVPYLIAGDLVIIALILALGWHDLRFIIHS